MLNLRAVAVAAALSVALTAAVVPAGPGEAAPITREDGIHTESWFLNQSFLVLKDDLAEAQAAKKGFVLVWEQPGCGSCEKLHEINFQDKALMDYIGKNFAVMAMNMYGEVEVTDFDGEKMAEKDLAFKHRVNFTPTTIFFDGNGKEIFRMPGYFSPFYYLAGYVYVTEKGYEDPNARGMFPRWLKTNTDKVKAVYGKDPE